MQQGTPQDTPPAYRRLTPMRFAAASSSPNQAAAAVSIAAATFAAPHDVVLKGWLVKEGAKRRDVQTWYLYESDIIRSSSVLREQLEMQNTTLKALDIQLRHEHEADGLDRVLRAMHHLPPANGQCQAIEDVLSVLRFVDYLDIVKPVHDRAMADCLPASCPEWKKGAFKYVAAKLAQSTDHINIKFPPVQPTSLLSIIAVACMGLGLGAPLCGVAMGDARLEEKDILQAIHAFTGADSTHEVTDVDARLISELLKEVASKMDHGIASELLRRMFPDTVVAMINKRELIYVLPPELMNHFLQLDPHPFHQESDLLNFVVCWMARNKFEFGALEEMLRYVKLEHCDDIYLAALRHLVLGDAELDLSHMELIQRIAFSNQWPTRRGFNPAAATTRPKYGDPAKWVYASGAILRLQASRDYYEEDACDVANIYDPWKAHKMSIFDYTVGQRIRNNEAVSLETTKLALRITK